MLDDKSLLDLCLKVSGSFENGGGARYDSLTGNDDGQGMSVGILQWNAGQGTLQQLLIEIGTEMGWDKAQSYFKSDIHQLALASPANAVAFCLDHYIATGGTHIDPAVAAIWKNFLTQPESINSQVVLASKTVLAHAKRLVTSYTPAFTSRLRPYAFFFDVCTQEGGMAVGHTVIQPVGTIPDVTQVLAFAQVNDAKCAAIWTAASQGDDLAKLLLYYAYQRVLLAKAQYRWDACSRRGTIACRGGIVHEGNIDLTSVLD